MLLVTTKVPRMQSKIIYFHTGKIYILYILIHELLFPNSWPKNLGAAYTRANTVINFINTISVFLLWCAMLQACFSSSEPSWVRTPISQFSYQAQLLYPWVLLLIHLVIIQQCLNFKIMCGSVQDTNGLPQEQYVWQCFKQIWVADLQSDTVR
jgi:hypothetical protein